MDDDMSLLWLIGFICLVVAIAIFGQCHYDKGYKQGQINYGNGKIEYTLQTNIDKTVEWVEVEVK